MNKHTTLVSVLLAGSAVALIVASIVALLTGAILDYPAKTLALKLPTTPFSASSAVARENALPGTSQWQLDVGANTTFIQGYAGAVSAVAGDTVPLYISTAVPSTYALGVYRIGWYGGLGGRLLMQQTALHSLAQGIWTAHLGLLHCASCLRDPKTHLLEAHWQPAFLLPIGLDWPSGVYLIKLTAANHAESYIPLVIRADAAHTAALASLPVNTYQAYNLWGDDSLYGHDDLMGHIIYSQRAVKVSFDRPYDRSAGAGDFLSWDIHLVRWMERSHLDVSYTTDVDVHERPATVMQHPIFVVMAHDEYYTASMRDALEHARDAGVSLAFMGADAVYWQNRYQPDSLGQADRTLICYKVVTGSHDVTERPDHDPYLTLHPTLVTTLWRDPILHRPESTLIGLSYHSIFANNYFPDWVVSDDAANPMLAGTGLQPDEHVKGGLLGYEYDGLGAPQFTPPGLVILAKSRVMSRYGESDNAQTAYYRAPSGALVFDAGSIWWSWGLDELSPVGAAQRNVLQGNPAIAKLTTNIFDAMFAASPALSSQTPSAAATAQP